MMCALVGIKIDRVGERSMKMFLFASASIVAVLPRLAA
jgi:hypothetical protein